MPSGEVKTEKTTEQKLKDTMNLQSNEYDKLWLYLSNLALWGVMDDAQLTPAKMQEILTDMEARMRRMAQPKAEEGKRIVQARRPGN